MVSARPTEVDLEVQLSPKLILKVSVPCGSSALLQSEHREISRPERLTVVINVLGVIYFLSIEVDNFV